jgi:hypothetical protein
MESKPTVEQFMRDFFRERTAALKMVLESRRDYRLRYYHSECLSDSRRGVVKTSEAEKIVEVSPSEIGFGVVTTGNGLHRLRYHVKPSSESWSIQEVDTECGHRRIFGASYECAQCGGTGWMSWQDRQRFISEHQASRTTSSSPDEELGEGRFRNPAIEQFMIDHFRERTALLKKEVEIHADYAKRFYGPACDWTRWVGSVQASEAETIVRLIPADTGAQVITRNFTKWQLRYNLRPVGQSWLIWEVNMACHRCENGGRRADCSSCGGTGWIRIKDKQGLARGEPSGEEPPSEKPRWKLE